MALFFRRPSKTSRADAIKALLENELRAQDVSAAEITTALSKVNDGTTSVQLQKLLAPLLAAQGAERAGALVRQATESLGSLKKHQAQEAAALVKKFERAQAELDKAQAKFAAEKAALEASEERLAEKHDAAMEETQGVLRKALEVELAAAKNVANMAPPEVEEPAPVEPEPPLQVEPEPAVELTPTPTPLVPEPQVELPPPTPTLPVREEPPVELPPTPMPPVREELAFDPAPATPVPATSVQQAIRMIENPHTPATWAQGYDRARRWSDGQKTFVRCDSPEVVTMVDQVRDHPNLN